MPRPTDSAFARRLLVVKAAGTLLALFGVALYFGRQWMHRRLGVETGVVYSWTGAYRWFTALSPRLWMQAAAVVLGSLVLLEWWPRRLTPQRPVSRTVALGIALASALALATMQTFRFYALYGAIVLMVCVVGFVAAYYLMQRPAGRPAVAALGDLLRTPLTWQWFLVLATAATITHAIGWREILGGQPIMSDSQSQIAQARLLLTGHLALDVSRPLRDVIAFPYALYSVPSFSQYPPGHILLLVPVIAAGLPPQALNMAAGLLTLLLSVSLARRWEGPAVARAVGLLLLGSPLLLLMSVSAMNHATTCLMLLVTIGCLMPEARGAPPRALRRDLALCALGGLTLGWAVLTRPLTGLAHGLVWAGVWIGLMAEALWWRAPEGASPRRLLARLAAALAGLVPAALIFLAYNRATTGDPLVMAYRESNPLLHRLGFHDATAGGLGYTPVDAVNTLFSDLMSLNRTMLGLAVGSWTLLLIWWLRTRLPRRHLVLAALFAIQVLLYKLYQFHDLFFGPRFLFEALPAMALLAGAGLRPVLDNGGRRAGGVFLILAILTFGAFTQAIDVWGEKFSPQVRDHEAIERFVEGVLPVDRPTVIVVPHSREEMVGRWFAQPTGTPALWFVVREKLADARALPELTEFDWIFFDPNDLSPTSSTEFTP
jgi:hypothetical protein